MTEKEIPTEYSRKMTTKGPISDFITHYYRHFNAAALVDAAKGYEDQLTQGSKMLVSLAGPSWDGFLQK